MKMVNVMRLLLVSLFFQIFSANAQQWCGFQEVNKFHTPSEVPVQPTKRNSLNIPKIIPTIVHILHEGEPYGVFSEILLKVCRQCFFTRNGSRHIHRVNTMPCDLTKIQKEFA